MLSRLMPTLHCTNRAQVGNTCPPALQAESSWLPKDQVGMFGIQLHWLCLGGGGSAYPSLFLGGGLTSLVRFQT